MKSAHASRTASLLVGALIATASLLALPTAPAQAALPSESQWRADVTHALRGSHRWLDARVERSAGRDVRLAINLDIDNSALASHYHPGHAIPQVLKLALEAHDLGVALVFNTARHGAQLDDSITQLEHAGYPVDELCGKRDGKEAVAHSKQRCRRHFVNEGYTIIANIGNHSTDFVGKNYERAFRLPSYHNKLT